MDKVIFISFFVIAVVFCAIDYFIMCRNQIRVIDAPYIQPPPNRIQDLKPFDEAANEYGKAFANNCVIELKEEVARRQKKRFRKMLKIKP